MSELEFRPPGDGDWPIILAIANESVAAVQGAGDQSEWLSNRRRSVDQRFGEHLVATEAGQIIGYAAAEPIREPAGAFRLFVVASVADRERIGEALLDLMFRTLNRLDATEAHFIEYATDTLFIAFLEEHGFHQAGRIALSTDLYAIALKRSAPFCGACK